MSAFLGPIHYWLYNKIQIQEEWIEEILEIGKKNKIVENDLREESYKKYGKSVREPLETVINEENIHGWLQERITSVEYRMAYIVTSLVTKEKGLWDQMKQILKENGHTTFQKEEHVLTPETAYKAIFDALLEGMPCDRVNEVLESSEESIMWETTSCIHQSYWEEVNGDVEIFYELRKAWIEGFLEESSLKYECSKNKINKIVRG